MSGAIFRACCRLVLGNR